MRDVVPGELVVGYRRGVDRRRRADVRRRAGVRLKRTPAVPGVELVRLGPGRSPAAAGRSLERRSEVAYVEPNRFVEAATMPNDPRFGSLWGLHNDGRPGRRDADVDAPEAWRITRGSPRVTVAVVDTGIASGHPDLARNIWTNPGETGVGAERNGLDDDKNGYVDDSRGWDWTDDGNDPRDVWWHGSHVAGIVGARGNNGRGVAGLSWHGRLMALKVLGDRGRGFTVDVAAGFAYAGRMGARVVNASLTSDHRSQVVVDAVRSHPRTLFVVAAGNGSDGTGADNTGAPKWPCAITAPNLICIAASDQWDRLARFSNFGLRSVDLAAPGQRVVSTGLDHNDHPAYMSAWGTSMASPHVAGTAALLWARHPTASLGEVRQALLSGVDRRPSLVGRTVTGGRLNARRALEELAR